MFKRDFRIESKKSRQIHNGEQKVAYFFFDGATIGDFERFLKLRGFFFQLFKNSFDTLPVKADLRGSARHLVGFK